MLTRPAANLKASVVIAPDSAPKNKVDKMRHETFGLDAARAPCTVLPVPYERWWRVVETGDPTEELEKGGAYVQSGCCTGNREKLSNS